MKGVNGAIMGIRDGSVAHKVFVGLEVAFCGILTVLVAYASLRSVISKGDLWNDQFLFRWQFQVLLKVWPFGLVLQGVVYAALLFIAIVGTVRSVRRRTGMGTFLGLHIWMMAIVLVHLVLFVLYLPQGIVEALRILEHLPLNE